MRLRKKQTKEGAVKLAIVKYCLARGWVGGKLNVMGVTRLNKSGNMFYCKDPYLFTGIADLLFFRPCKKPYYDYEIVFIECKAEKNKQSDSQKEFEKYCKRSGVKYILAYSVEDVIRYEED